MTSVRCMWLLRKMNRKKDKDYIMIRVRDESLDGFGFMDEVRLKCSPKTIAFISKCFNWDK